MMKDKLEVIRENYNDIFERAGISTTDLEARRWCWERALMFTPDGASLGRAMFLRDEFESIEWYNSLANGDFGSRDRIYWGLQYILATGSALTDAQWERLKADAAQIEEDRAREKLATRLPRWGAREALKKLIEEN